MTKKDTGLGTGAFFQTPKRQHAQTEELAPVEPEREKVNTSIRLYKDTLPLLEACKVYVRKSTGKKAASCDVIEEALQEWAAKRNLEI